MEIAEEEEEEQRAPKRQSIVKEEDRSIASDDSASAKLPSHLPAAPPVTLNAQLANSPNESQFAGTTEPPPFTGIERPSSPAKSLDPRRLSSQLTRAEMHSYAAYAYGKPKVKLAPRPSFDVSGRPRTSAGTSGYRPVSAIPAGFKLFSKGSRKGRGDSKADGKLAKQIDEEKRPAPPTLSAADIAAITVPSMPGDSLDVQRPYTSGGRPTSSSGLSVKSIATTAATTATTKQSAMTPEKARLMKAMKLREKKKKMSILSSVPIPVVDIIEAPTEPVVRAASHADEPSDAASVAGTSFMGSFYGRPGSSGELSTSNNFASTTGSADSAIDVELPAIDQASIDTHTTNSHPTSPLAMSSDIGDSTKASSLSESTDETVQALRDLKLEALAGEAEEEMRASMAQDAETPTSVGDAHENSEAFDESDKEHGVILDRASPPPVTENPLSGGPIHRPSSAFTPTGDDGSASTPLEIYSTPTPSLDSFVEAADSSRPATSTTLKFSQPPEDDTPTTPLAISSIAVPEVPDSLTPSDLETSEATSADTKRARRRALIEPIRTNMSKSREDEEALYDANLSDDDELMEELQSATVQEAKPMIVSKSPINPVFPASSSPSKLSRSPGGDAHTLRVIRTVSNPLRSNLLVPGDVSTSSARSVSSGVAFLHKITQQNSANLAPKKSNIGSSISQRIKALEKLSGSTGVPAAEAPTRVERPVSTFFNVRKASGRDAAKAPLVAERASSLTRDKTPSPPTSRESTPEVPKLTPRDRSGSMASRLSVFEGGNLPRGRPESVRVKARIIRDPMQPFPQIPDSHFDPSKPGQLDLKQSPLVVDHQKASPLPMSAFHIAMPSPAPAEPAVGPMQKRGSIQERRMSKEKRRSQSQDRSTIADDAESTRPRRRSSLSIVKDFIKERRGSVLAGRSFSTDNLNSNLASPASLSTPAKSPSRPPSVYTNHASHGIARRLSISSRRSMSKDQEASPPPLSTPMSPSLMTETSNSGDEGKSSTSEFGHRKTGSGSKNRATRFMRRLSSSFSSGRKATTPTISPTVAEEDEAHSAVPPSRGSFAVQPTIVSYIGDVNVQFPDNLLWKRRTMCIDSQGFLILSAGNGVSVATTAVPMAGSDRPTGVIKRYHVSDFRVPYVPEMEVQELPNSVCLDFVDGSGLQVACEDRAGQLNVLQSKWMASMVCLVLLLYSYSVLTIVLS